MRMQDAILEVFLKNKNQAVTLNQLCHETGIEASKVQSNVNNLKNSKKDHFTIETITRGQIWILRDSPEKSTPGKRIFEEIGPIKDGSIVIQDGDGNLFKAVEL